MPFSNFHGNAETVSQIRQMLGRDRFPHAVIVAGPRGAGKFTLSQMIAKAMNCLESPQSDGLPDFCGRCVNCTRIAQADDLDARVAEAIEAREGLREADKRETRLLIQTHPDVLVIPPDPPQNMIKVDQVRRVTASIYFRPAEARRRVFTFTDSAFMKEAANALLKVLEEPPEFATLFLLTENPGELLPTIRSRAGIFRLGALPTLEIERLLAERRPQTRPAERALIARLAEGATGRALGFDLPAYLASRADALILLRTSVQEPDLSTLFRMTDTYRAGAEGQEKTDNLIRAAASLLEDLLLLKSSAAALLRNIDLEKELTTLANAVTFEWIEGAARGLRGVESGMRRNLLRSLALDSFAAQLGSS